MDKKESYIYIYIYTVEVIHVLTFTNYLHGIIYDK